jgi:hypothetical protein
LSRSTGRKRPRGLGHLDCVDAVGLKDGVTPEDLLGLHERAVDDAARADGPDLVDRIELVPGVGQFARAAVLLVPGPNSRLEVRPLQLLSGLGDQAEYQVLHR